MFTVYGTARPQGSVRGFVSKAGKVVIAHSDTQLTTWRNDVRSAALIEMKRLHGNRDDLPIADCPVTIEIRFTLMRPKSAKRKYPTVRPDLDKLIRAVLDALTGVVIKDDSIVCDLVASKRYCVEGPAKTEVIVNEIA